MRLHRFILPIDISHDGVVIQDRDCISQIRNVLRLEVHDLIVVCNGMHEEAICRIEKLSPSEMQCAVQERKTLSIPLQEVTLYCALLKQDHFDLVAQKATEVGIHTLVPIQTAHTVKLKIKPLRIEKIMREAAEQSGRGSVPTLEKPSEVPHAIEHSTRNNQVFYCDIHAKSTAETLLQAQKRIGIFIGPEGGWSDDERTAFRKAGILAVSLGPAVLRAETAAIIASYLSCVRND
jgi:16S rRNA (uracil1498-N3)-methyltransferase